VIMASQTQAANSGSIDANGGNRSSAVANGNTNVEGGDLIHFLEPSITEGTVSITVGSGWSKAGVASKAGESGLAAV